MQELYLDRGPRQLAPFSKPAKPSGQTLTWKYCTAELSSVLSENIDSLAVPVLSEITRSK